MVGVTVTLDELFADGYHAIFLGTGAGLPKMMNVPGENFVGVFSANEFLTRVNLLGASKFPDFDTRFCIPGTPSSSAAVTPPWTALAWPSA